jgi:hypothetical protein
MTRILYWNIQQFSRNKIANPSAAVVGGNGGLSQAAASRQRRQQILNVVAAFDPQILVVVEVSTGNHGPGQLLTRTKGRGGCRALAWMLRNQMPNGGDWQMVPPLQVGQNGPAEGVAVFYRAVDRAVGGAVVVNRYFTGPDRWTGGENGITARGGGAIGDYPAQEANLLMALPPGKVPRIIPFAALYGGGNRETRRAARVDFLTAGMAPVAVNFGNANYRTPYMTTFTEQTVAGGAIKDITLFTVHTPPRFPAAPNFINAMATAADIMDQLAANEVKVIVGDFNVNLLLANGNQAAFYNNLLAVDAAGDQYILGLHALPGWVPGNVAANKGYFATHIKKGKRAILWSTAANQPFYPGYGYVGATTQASLYSIDNILIKQAGVPPVANNGVTIANTVVGSPLNGRMPLPPGVSQGAVALADEFGAIPMGVAWPSAPNAPPTQNGLAAALRGWNNYGRIFSTSDHLGVYGVV